MANTVDKIIKVAEAEVGYLEKKTNEQLDNKTANAGSNNYTKYGKAMGCNGQPWCDAFFDWCMTQAYGATTAKKLLGGYSNYTPTSAQYYKNMGRWHTSNPQIGDQIFFKNSTRICHTGLVYKVDSTKVYTIEGNTSGASGVIANGGGVCKKSYLLTYSNIAGYGRPAYDVSSTTSTTTSTKNISTPTSTFKSYKVKITANTLNIRSGAGTSNKIVGTTKNGTTHTILAESNGWGKIGDNKWISLSTKYVQKV